MQNLKLKIGNRAGGETDGTRALEPCHTPAPAWLLRVVLRRPAPQNTAAVLWLRLCRAGRFALPGGQGGFRPPGRSHPTTPDHSKKVIWMRPTAGRRVGKPPRITGYYRLLPLKKTFSPPVGFKRQATLCPFPDLRLLTFDSGQGDAGSVKN